MLNEKGDSLRMFTGKSMLENRCLVINLKEGVSWIPPNHIRPLYLDEVNTHEEYWVARPSEFPSELIPSVLPEIVREERDYEEILRETKNPKLIIEKCPDLFLDLFAKLSQK
jgi:hypothetical protein